MRLFLPSVPFLPDIPPYPWGEESSGITTQTVPDVTRAISDAAGIEPRTVALIAVAVLLVALAACGVVLFLRDRRSKQKAPGCDIGAKNIDNTDSKDVK